MIWENMMNGIREIIQKKKEISIYVRPGSYTYFFLELTAFLPAFLQKGLP